MSKHTVKVKESKHIVYDVCLRSFTMLLPWYIVPNISADALCSVRFHITYVFIRDIYCRATKLNAEKLRKGLSEAEVQNYCNDLHEARNVITSKL